MADKNTDYEFTYRETKSFHLIILEHVWKKIKKGINTTLIFNRICNKWFTYQSGHEIIKLNNLISS